ncbi:ABC transporter ATP-binding protein [Trinickia sp. EG282A]|uniref:ABC transporter ATP-binding protein n=1 Tax=Trinickia sp. EG282A TaxID=3237013 RepID=UPI0034D1FDD4
MNALMDARGVRAWYGEAQVLQGVDMGIDAGEIVALCGRNGSGRSTLAKALVGLVRRAGSIRFAGEESIEMPTFEIARRGMGYVAEQRDVFPTLTVEENLRLGVKPKGAVRANVTRLLDQAFSRFPLLAQRRKTNAGALSGGEQQLLALARALMGEPRLLIVDEPTEGLAPQAVAAMADCLLNVRKQGASILLIEQRLMLARAIADRVAVMGHGRIVHDGPIETLDARIVEEWIALGGGR